MHKNQSFKSYYTQTTIFNENMRNDTSVNYIKNSILTDSTLNISNNELVIQDASTNSNSLWINKLIPLDNVFINFTCSHNNDLDDIVFSVLGNLITLTSTGVLSIQSTSKTVTIQNYISSEKYNFNVYIFGDFFSIQVKKYSGNQVYTLIHTSSLQNQFSIGNGIWYSILLKNLNNMSLLNIMGSSLVFNTFIESKMNLLFYEQNQCTFNNSINNSNITSGIPNQFNNIISNNIKNAKSILLFVLEFNQVNLAETDPVQSFLQYVDFLIRECENEIFMERHHH